MTPVDLVVATEAYDYPLTLDHLLHTGLTCSPAREIVYESRGRLDYRELRRRIGRLAAGLASLGVEPGATVAVMDWDSPRYLECFFAIPMMGAVLHTINVRLSPEQILYTINHAEDDVILVHTDFIPLIAQIGDRFERAPKLVLVRDGDDDDAKASECGLDFAADYESLLYGGEDGYDFPVLDERTRATTFYTTGTTGDPKGVWYTHRQLVLHTLGALGALASGGGHARLHRDDVYMPITPMFHVHGWGMPFVATLLGIKQVYPGRYEPEKLLRLIERERVTFSHCVPTILHMLLGAPVAGEIDLSGWKVVIGGSAMSAGLARAAMDRGIDVFGDMECRRRGRCSPSPSSNAPPSRCPTMRRSSCAARPAGPCRSSISASSTSRCARSPRTEQAPAKSCSAPHGRQTATSRTATDRKRCGGADTSTPATSAISTAMGTSASRTD